MVSTEKKFSVEIWDANDYLECSKHRDRDTENGSEHDFDGNNKTFNYR